MKTDDVKASGWVVAAILVAGMLPVVLYLAFFVGGINTVGVAEARRVFGETNRPAVLVDVREPEAFGVRHVAGATNWPYASIRSVERTNEIPANLIGRRLLLICDVGMCSALAAKKLGALGGVNATSVAGGMEAWNTSAGESLAAPREMTALEQGLAVITGFGVKPTYMVLSLVLIVALWRQHAPDLAALRWGMIWFLGGETACAINYLFLGSESHLVEYLHSYGMTVGFAFTAFAVLEGMDQRLIKVSPASERCAALGLCGACIKYAEVPCGLQRVFRVVIPACLVLALMPLCARLQVDAYNVKIFGSVYTYSHPVVYQLYETRYCPVLAFLLFVGSWCALAFKRSDNVWWAKIWFAAAVGPLGFGMVRLFLFAGYRDALIWFDVWEELTELLFVGGVALVLWLFRHRLFAVPAGGAVPSRTG